jgi:2-polyprenyl-6-methoxyphenol hydroxylase-like FAD-dependent oxidoreductase
MSRLADRAVVIGGSIAGLLTARVLSDYFEHVTILERDAVEDRPVHHRSVPQGHHRHALLHGGQDVLESLYPLLRRPTSCVLSALQEEPLRSRVLARM